MANDWVKNRNVAIVTFSVMFSIPVFFIMLAVFSDIIDDYTGVEVTVDVDSTGNYMILIYSLSLLGTILASALISNINPLKAIIAVSLSFLLNIVIFTLISIFSLNYQYPAVFTGREAYEILLNFSEINTKFVMYILRNAWAYFFILMGTMITLSYLIIQGLHGFDD